MTDTRAIAFVPLTGQGYARARENTIGWVLEMKLEGLTAYIEVPCIGECQTEHKSKYTECKDIE